MLDFNIIHILETHSTNIYLETLSDTGSLNEGAVVYSDKQSAGKGQGTNKWESEAHKNLTMSVLLKPTFLKANQQFYLNKAISLAVCDTVDSFIDTNSQIKWPNDIYVGNHKIAGILIEHSVMGDVIFESIIGIGLNVNQTEFRSNAPNPISVKQISGRNTSIEDVLAVLLQNIDKRYRSLKENLESSSVEYLSHLYALNSIRSFVYKGEAIEGKIIGINEYGQLIIEGTESQKWVCGQQEVKFILG